MPVFPFLQNSLGEVLIQENPLSFASANILEGYASCIGEQAMSRS
jgi:hypothetical protein